MDNSVYIALSRQVALFRDLDVTANNVANVNTGGYMAQDLQNTTFNVDAGNHNQVTFANPVSTYRRLDPGSMKTTGNPLDAAILGPGYFTIQTPLGDRYTKAGNFQLDPNGTLVTSTGNPVLDNSGQPITFDPTDTNIVIGSIGNISVNGSERATLGIVTFDNQQAMEPVGDGIYRSDAAPIPNPEDGSITVSQGTLEGSNADPIKQLTHLVELQRTVSLTNNMINALYTMDQETSKVFAQQ